MPDRNLTPAQWGTVFSVLCLDLAQPLLAGTGWQSPDPVRALELVRTKIAAARLVAIQNPEAPPRLAASYLRDLEAAFGAAEVQRFRTWVTRVFHETHADAPHWSGWQIVFEEWRLHPETRPGAPTTPEDWTPLMKAYAKAVDLASWQEKATAAKQGLLSEWDLLVFARRGYLFDDDVADPMILILSWIGRAQFQNFWREHFVPLSLVNKEAMRRRGDEILRRLQVWMPGPLEIPSES